MGNRAHSPELIVAHVPIVARVLVIACVLVVACILVLTHFLVLTHVLVVARVRAWALGVICEPRWPLWLVVVHACRGLWVMVKGAHRRGWWWSPVSGFVVVGARRQSWVVGRSLPLWLVVVYALWMVVVVCGRLSSLSSWAVMLWALVVVHVGVVVGLLVVHALWLVVVCGQLWWWL